MVTPSKRALLIALIGISVWLIDGILRPLSWLFGRRRERVQMEPCPGCGLKLPADDLWAQKAHMESSHPEIIAERLRAAGLQP